MVGFLLVAIPFLADLLVQILGIITLLVLLLVFGVLATYYGATKRGEQKSS